LNGSMATTELLLANLLSPMVLAFALGVLARLVRSDLRVPEELHQSLSIYLLLAIGLKGGVELSRTPLAGVAAPLAGTLVLGIVTPLTAYAVLRLGRFDVTNAAALAAHYGSVSAVTFIAAIAFAEAAGARPESFLPALVAVLEVPAIVVALLLARLRAPGPGGLRAALHEIVTGRSVLLLAGGMVIGLLGGERSFAPVEPFFVGLFRGALVLFLLDMGIAAAGRLGDLRRLGGFLAGFAIVMPIVHGALGAAVGTVAGLSPAGSAVFAAMVASASYIAAPAAVRLALPAANPTLYLTASLGVTFPFNLTVGIPLYFEIAGWLAR